jgi:hypothetical protein
MIQFKFIALGYTEEKIIKTSGTLPMQDYMEIPLVLYLPVLEFSCIKGGSDVLQKKIVSAVETMVEGLNSEFQLKGENE